ncbi:MAG: hypothetical protein OK474_09195 [Thaumarchaeota archaeon]|nr:hypothetical protein [Nitrososphaerota archaeon]
MEQTPHPIDASVNTILPVLKSFPTNEVAIIGCHALNLSRRSCEYDLLIVNRDPIPEKFIKVGEGYAKIIFRNERDVRQPDPQLALTLASAVPLRDSSLLLAGATSDCKRSFSANCRKSMETRLASSLKSLARAEELLSEKETQEADLSLLSAARDFAYAELLMSEKVPSPSHVLGQIKALPKRRPSSFKQWADAFGLELASRVSCENRFDALSVIYDVLRTSAFEKETVVQMGRYREIEAIQVMEMKVGELLSSMQSAECFSFLGQEVVQSLVDLYLLHVSRLSKEKNYSRVIRELTVGSDRLISEDVVKSLGLVRSPEIIRSAASGLKSAVSSLAKRI